MSMRSGHAQSRSLFWYLDGLRDELDQALDDAKHELEVLPDDPEAAVIGFYAVMDDLRETMTRIEALDHAHTRLEQRAQMFSAPAAALAG